MDGAAEARQESIERVAVEQAARAIYDANHDLWMTTVPFAMLHPEDQEKLRAMAKAALATVRPVDARRVA